jgi:hypothetical protein
MEPLTTVEDVDKGLDFDVLEDLDLNQITETAIEDLSDDARFYGLDSWIDPAHTPVQVCRLVRRAVIRHMRNYDGYTVSRAGDETLGWSDLGERAGSPFFTEEEKRMLASYVLTKPTFHSVGISAWGTVLRPVSAGLVPTGTGSKPFPMFASEDSPW